MLQNRRRMYCISLEFVRLALRSQKTPPGAELRNPADLVDQLPFFTRVLLFIPHDEIFRFPARVDCHRNHRNGNGCRMNSDCDSGTMTLFKLTRPNGTGPQSELSHSRGLPRQTHLKESVPAS